MALSKMAFMGFLVLPFTFLSTIASADSSETKIGLERFQTCSLVYSETAGKALVQVINPGSGLSNFAECKVALPFISIAKSLSNCTVNDRIWFLPTEENVVKLSEFFQTALSVKYSTEVANEKKYTGRGAALGAGLTTLSVGFIGMALFTEMNSAAAYPIWGMRTLLAGMGGLVGLAAFTYFLYEWNAYVRSQEAPPSLEYTVVKAMKSIADFKKTKVIEIPPEEASDFFLLNYKLIKSSLFESLEQMNAA